MQNYCKNHPTKKALSFCHSCGEYYCKDCLNEGKEYYYCNDLLCYEKYESESARKETKPVKLFPKYSLRAAAIVIDIVILFIINTILFIPLYFLGSKINPQDIILKFDLFIVFRHPMFFWVGLFYFSIMESSKYKGTFGKRIQEIVVVTKKGGKISLLRGLARNTCRILSAISIIGYLLPLFTKRKQTLHDLICGTVVLNADALSSFSESKIT